jgi:alcohol dehydrogenase
MRALQYEQFGSPLKVTNVPYPDLPADGVIVEVRASGICRSDWHGWQGHEVGIQKLPHIPGHEFAGVIAEVGRDVKSWKPGTRVTAPFVLGCGACIYCAQGDQQVCEKQYQPGFEGPGSFAEYVALPYAESNLVSLPEEIDYVEAAVLGCRLVTAYRGIAKQARLAAGEWMAVFGCGGVGLSAIMIARALGANVVAVDIAEDKLALAKEAGAEIVLDASKIGNMPQAVRDLTPGGVHVSVDALGSAKTCKDSIRSLRRRGRHVQIGLMVGEDAKTALPLARIIAHEITIFGSHGMQAHVYPELFEIISSGRLPLKKLVGRRVTLDEAGVAVETLGSSPGTGITVIDRFAA